MNIVGIEIYNVLGEQVLLKSNTLTTSIDVSDLKEGVYFLRVSDADGGMHTEQFQKN